MSSFEFIFSLFSLLLGFSLVELLSGLGRTLKLRLHVDRVSGGESEYRIGLLTPLLGLFVMLDLLSFWSAAWTLRDLLTVSGRTLMGTMLFASAYYLAAHLVFPDDPAKVRDLDQHYFQVRRTVFSVLLTLLLVQLGLYASIPQLATQLLNPTALGLTALLVALIAAAFVFKSKALNTAILLALVTRYVLAYAI